VLRSAERKSERGGRGQGQGQTRSNQERHGRLIEEGKLAVAGSGVASGDSSAMSIIESIGDDLVCGHSGEGPLKGIHVEYPSLFCDRFGII